MANLNSVFQQYLGRDIDDAGKKYFEAEMAKGMTIDQVRSAVASSDEYKSKASASNDRFNYVDHDKNSSTAPVLGNNPNFKEFMTPEQINQTLAGSHNAGKFTYVDGKYVPTLGTGLSPTTPVVKEPEKAAAPSFTRRNDSVIDGVTKLMSQDSPLIRQAQTSGLQLANRRGLLNSSMAAQAAQDAAYTAAVPIASQEASQAAAENLANLDAQTRIYMQNQTIGAADRQQANEIAYQTAMKALDRDLQEKLSKWNLNESQRASAAQSVLASQELYNNRINNIMANTNLAAKDREAQLAAAKSFFDIQMNLVQQMFDVSLTWS